MGAGACWWWMLVGVSKWVVVGVNKWVVVGGGGY